MRLNLFLLFALLLSLSQLTVAGEQPIVAGEQLVVAGEQPDVAGEKPAVAGQKFRVVINHEEQYSIWVAEQELPAGWKATGFVGSKELTLQHIEEVWTDMRPLSERRKVALQIYQKLLRKK